MDASLDAKPGLGNRSVRSRLVGRLVAGSIVAVVALSLPACGGGGGDSESSGKTSSGSTLPRDIIIPLDQVKELLPEMT